MGFFLVLIKSILKHKCTLAARVGNKLHNTLAGDEQINCIQIINCTRIYRGALQFYIMRATQKHGVRFMLLIISLCR